MYTCWFLRYTPNTYIIIKLVTIFLTIAHLQKEAKNLIEYVLG